MYALAVHEMLSLRTVGTLKAGSNGCQPPLPLAHPVRLMCVGSGSSKEMCTGVFRGPTAVVAASRSTRGTYTSPRTLKDPSSASVHCDHESLMSLGPVKASSCMIRLLLRAQRWYDFGRHSRRIQNTASFGVCPPVFHLQRTNGQDCCHGCTRSDLVMTTMTPTGGDVTGEILLSDCWPLRHHLRIPGRRQGVLHL